MDLFDLVDMFIKDSINIEADRYASHTDYFIDRIIMRLNYLKSEYKKNFDAGNKTEARKIRANMVDIMPGYVIRQYIDI